MSALNAVSDERLLWELICRNAVGAAPVRTTRETPHVEALIAIGPDHTAHVTMDGEAFAELSNRLGGTR